MDNLLGLTAPAPLSLGTLATNLLLAILLSSATAWFYTRYGRSLSNRALFAQGLPVLALTTVLVISIVKSSLALSLGLVGALSIVRFRTAIKEPEELLYLFVAIAIGLGLGADQRVPTILATIVILTYVLVRRLFSPPLPKNNLYVNILSSSTDSSLSQINDVLHQHVSTADLRRLDRGSSSLQATYLVSCSNDKAVISLTDALAETLPDCQVTFVEQDASLGG
jgi:uncharacterized membrane protein YhiD involved in acid resistance